MTQLWGIELREGIYTEWCERCGHKISYSKDKIGTKEAYEMRNHECKSDVTYSESGDMPHDPIDDKLESIRQKIVANKEKVDMVNHPPHYTQHPSGVECIDITEWMSFCLGNATKYIWRAGLKCEDPIQDLKKAKWYIEREIKRLSNG